MSANYAIGYYLSTVFPFLALPSIAPTVNQLYHIFLLKENFTQI